MIGLLGVAIVVGQLLMDIVKSPRFHVYYWIGVLTLLLWIVLLAVADMVATRLLQPRAERPCRRAREAADRTSQGPRTSRSPPQWQAGRGALAYA